LDDIETQDQIENNTEHKKYMKYHAISNMIINQNNNEGIYLI